MSPNITLFGEKQDTTVSSRKRVQHSKGYKAWQSRQYRCDSDFKFTKIKLKEVDNNIIQKNKNAVLRIMMLSSYCQWWYILQGKGKAYQEMHDC